MLEPSAESMRQAENAYIKIPEKDPGKRVSNPNATTGDPCHGCPDRDTPLCNNEHCLIEDPEDEKGHWKRMAYEFRNYPSTMGRFDFHLCEAILRADLANTEKLKKAFPELVRLLQETDL